MLDQDDFRKLLATPRPDGPRSDAGGALLGARTKRPPPGTLLPQAKRERTKESSRVSTESTATKPKKAPGTGGYRDRAQERREGRVDEDVVSAELMHQMSVEALAALSAPQPMSAAPEEDDSSSSEEEEDDASTYPSTRVSAYAQGILDAVRDLEEENDDVSSAILDRTKHDAKLMGRAVYVFDSTPMHHHPWSIPTTLIRSLSVVQEKRRARAPVRAEGEALVEGMALLWRKIRRGERAEERRRAREEEAEERRREEEDAEKQLLGEMDLDGEDIFEDAGRDYEVTGVHEGDVRVGEDIPPLSPPLVSTAEPPSRGPISTAKPDGPETSSLDQFLRDAREEAAVSKKAPPPQYRDEVSPVAMKRDIDAEEADAEEYDSRDLLDEYDRMDSALRAEQQGTSRGRHPDAFRLLTRLDFDTPEDWQRYKEQYETSTGKTLPESSRSDRRKGKGKGKGKGKEDEGDGGRKAQKEGQAMRDIEKIMKSKYGKGFQED